MLFGFSLLIECSIILPSDLAAKPTEIELKMQDSIFNSFLLNIDFNNYEKARSSLSAKVSQMVSDDKLLQLRNQYTKKDSLVIFMSGLTTSRDGSRLTVLQYKYLTDTSAPPSYMLKVEFNDQNKIVYIQPLQRDRLPSQ